MSAVCVRCGASKVDFDHVCPGCGQRPDGDGLLVAWLLSDHHLNGDELRAASNAVRQGRAPRPSDRQLEQARRALGVHIDTDPGLTWQQQVGLLATSVLLTPLVGIVAWAWWRETRPRTARRALALSLPVSVVATVLLLQQLVSATL